MRRENALGQPLHVAGGRGESGAAECMAARQDQAPAAIRPRRSMAVYARGNRETSEVAGPAAAVAHPYSGID